VQRWKRVELFQSFYDPPAIGVRTATGR